MTMRASGLVALCLVVTLLAEGEGVQQILDRIQPSDAKGWLQVSLACEKAGYLREAEDFLEKACTLDPEDADIASRFARVLDARVKALDPNEDIYADRVFEVADRAERAGLKRFAEELCVDIVGDGRRAGICPTHAGANARLGRVLTPWGTYEDAELFGDIAKIQQSREAERKLLAMLTPWQRSAYAAKKAVEARGVECDCIAQPPFLIAVQRSDKASAEVRAEDFRRIVAHLYVTFRREFADDIPFEELFEGAKAELVLPLVVYDSKSTYMAQNPGVPEWLGGHFDPDSGWVQTFASTGKPYEQIFHDCTLQLLAAATRVKGGKDTNCFWLAEGLATTLECAHREANNDFIIGAKSRQYLPMIQQFLKRKKEAPLGDILSKSYQQFRIEQSQFDPFKAQMYVGLHMSEAWSITFFLQTYDDGKYADKLHAFLRKEVAGEGSFDTFKSIFGMIEDDWRKYISGLSPD